MNYKEEFLKTRDLLVSFEPLWNQEVINNYPLSLKNYDDSWYDELSKLDKNSIFKIDSLKDFSDLDDGQLKRLLTGICEASQFNTLSLPKTELKVNAYTRVKPKKKHEIDSLLPLIIDLKESHNFLKVIDICGGIGHLSRIISAYKNIDSVCLDFDEKLFEVGKKIIKKHHPELLNSGRFRFHKGDFLKDNIDQLDKENQIFTDDSFLVGLHTCGPLSLKLFETAKFYNSKGFLNVGCCYSKLDPLKEINLSKIAKNRPLKISHQGLTLATRSHSIISKEEFKLKNIVKFYRYTLHLLLFEKLNIKNFLSFGNSKKELYMSDFATYALTNLNNNSIKHSFDKNYLNSFYKDESRIKLINKMFLSNIIRWQFGRLLEKYILLDRALYLQENNYEVEVKEIFDQNISPRNIAIIAIRN